jgi:hypothetical protein
MANDIAKINNDQPINNNKAICSTTFTGHSSKMVNNVGVPGDLTIANIENKFDNRFVNGIFVILSNGMVDGGPS